MSLRAVETFPASFESPRLLRRTIEGVKKIVKGHLRQRSKQVLKVEEGMEGGGKKHPCGKRDAKAHGWRE